nr:hypothetical protein [Gammaproteobacteria bacterium]
MEVGDAVAVVVHTGFAGTFRAVRVAVAVGVRVLEVRGAVAVGVDGAGWRGPGFCAVENAVTVGIRILEVGRA